MKRFATALLLWGCATVRTPEGEKELTRNAIHWRLAQCHDAADLYRNNHGTDAMRWFQCDQVAAQECLSAGLEKLCAEWQGGH